MKKPGQIKIKSNNYQKKLFNKRYKKYKRYKLTKNLF